MTPTLCTNCEHSHPDNAKRQPHKWMCMRQPRLEGAGFVTDGKWQAFDPWMYCVGINGGQCFGYEPKRGPQMELGE